MGGQCEYFESFSIVPQFDFDMLLVRFSLRELLEKAWETRNFIITSF